MTLVNAETGEVVSRSLDECEAVIERGLGTFVEVGEALMEIRDQRLYRSTHSDFDTYCRERWGFSRRRSDQLIGAAEVVGQLGTIVPSPTTESQARALGPLRDQPEQMAEVMAEVTEEAEATGTKVTAEKITERVKERTARPAPDVGDDHVTKYVEADPAIDLLRYRAAAGKAITRAQELCTFDPERLALSAGVDAHGQALVWESIGILRQSINDWFARLDQHRPSGLRVVDGGNQ